MNSTTGKQIDPEGVNHPKGYNSHPSGIETIEVIRHLPFGLGCAFKYVVRWQEKDGLRDLKKAKWYLDDLFKNPPTIAQVMVNAQVRHLIDLHVQSEPNAAARGFFEQVHRYLTGYGPAALRLCIKYVDALIEQAEAQPK